jgi:hypothetical protein
MLKEPTATRETDMITLNIRSKVLPVLTVFSGLLFNACSSSTNPQTPKSDGGADMGTPTGLGSDGSTKLDVGMPDVLPGNVLDAPIADVMANGDSPSYGANPDGVIVDVGTETRAEATDGGAGLDVTLGLGGDAKGVDATSSNGPAEAGDAIGQGAGVGGTDGGADNTGDGGEGTSVDAPSMLVDAPSTLVDAGDAAGDAEVDGGAGGAVDSSTCPATGPVCIGNATDDFSSGMLAPYWAPWDTCGTTTVSAGALVLDRPAACTGSLGAVLDTCNFEVCGDFDAQVDFALTNFAIPATASRYAGMNVHSVAAATPAWTITVERLDSSYVNASVPQQQNYKGYTTSSVDADSNFVATADTSGRFRITRVGTTLTAYYWNTSAWVPITSTSAPADPMLVIGVYAGSSDPTALTVTFDNFSIASTP